MINLSYLSSKTAKKQGYDVMHFVLENGLVLYKVRWHTGVFMGTDIVMDQDLLFTGKALVPEGEMLAIDEVAEK